MSVERAFKAGMIRAIAELTYLGVLVARGQTGVRNTHVTVMSPENFLAFARGAIRLFGEPAH